MTAIPRPPTRAGRPRGAEMRDRTGWETAAPCGIESAWPEGARPPARLWELGSQSPAWVSTAGCSSGSPGRSWSTGLDVASPSWPEADPQNSARAPSSALGSRRLELPPVIDEFTEAWERGEAPSAEAYLHRLHPADSEAAVELIYREYCLAEADGQEPDPSSYLARFPRHREPLERLLQMHRACSPSLLGRWLEPAGAEGGLPQAGDSIGPFLLRRELGRGGFARVFLAEQADLENRRVVVKVSTRATREPWLLARAQHPHIVEILSHALVDDGAFQMICMPFWGGATLAAILAARQQLGRTPVSGRDLLVDLDGVAAPEYPDVPAARPARAILAGLSYAQAMAWIVARSAEALSYAFGRNVVHGDIKPSNILLSADGNPMLLDFNLARDSVPEVAASTGLADPGGTLAYMAPERLRGLATAAEAGRAGGSGRPGDPASETRQLADGPREPGSLDEAPHRADIYAMGMVLLEALTGRPPLLADPPRAGDRQPNLGGFQSAARAYAIARDRSARALIRDFQTAGGRAIAPGLQAILARCLDPDPSRRYGRALELAEDLDRWRNDRPLAYTDEPFWGQTLPRWLRRHRRMLLTATLSLLTVGLVTTTLALRGSNRDLHQAVDAMAMDGLARQWDHPEARAFRFQRPRQTSVLEPDAPEFVEAAHRGLRDYGLLGPGDLPTVGNWRERPALRRLPAADREDLELWLMEQAYRYCRALEDRPDSPEDWRRALELLEAVTAPAPTRALEPLKRRLRALLGKGGSTAAPGAGDRASCAWLDAYLLGVLAECEPGSQDFHETAGSAPTRGPADVAAILDAQTLARRRTAERALGHYRTMLALRPHSFWGHYRAAVASYGLDRTAEAAGHLEQCLERRPENPVLQGQLAGCLMRLGKHQQALERCNQALEGAPELAEFYRTRAFIRAKLRQTTGLDKDIRHFELLSRMLPRTFWGGTALLARLTEGPAGRGDKVEVVEIPPEELDARTVLATEIFDAGDRELAATEFAKILLVEPDHLAARFARGIRAVKAGDYDQARRDLDRVLYHPDLLVYLRDNPGRWRQLREVANLYLERGRVEEARALARRDLDLAIDLKDDRGLSQYQGMSHYQLAQVQAVAGRTDPPAITEAAQQLARAFRAHPAYRQYYQRDRRFDPVRTRLDAALPPAEAKARAEVQSRTATAPVAQRAPTRRSPRAASIWLIPQDAQPE